MKAKILVVLLLVVVIAFSNCNKSGFTNNPQLTFKNVDATVFSQGDLVTFALNYTSLQGDIQGHIFVQKLTRNCPASNFEELDSIPASVPTQKYAKGEIDLTYVFNTTNVFDGNGNPIESITGPQCQGQNDTCVFRFALTDTKNRTSDTITSPVLIFLNN